MRNRIEKILKKQVQLLEKLSDNNEILDSNHARSLKDYVDIYDKLTFLPSEKDEQIEKKLKELTQDEKDKICKNEWTH